MTTEIHIRHALSSQDAEYIIAALDSSLPHLARIGSSQQWGAQPMSERPEQLDMIRNAVRDALAHRVSGGEGAYVEVFIAETEVAQAGSSGVPENEGAIVRKAEDGEGRFVQTAGAIVNAVFTSYLRDREELRGVLAEAEGKRNFLFFKALVSDYRAGPLRKGAGAALIEYVRRRAGELGKECVYLDCFGGNGGKLVK